MSTSAHIKNLDNKEAELKLLRERIENARSQKGMNHHELKHTFGDFTNVALAMDANNLLKAMVSKDNDLILCYLARCGKESLALTMVEKSEHMVSSRGILYLNIILNKMYSINDDSIDIRTLEKAYGYVGRGSWNKLSWILENKGRSREDEEGSIYDGSSYEEEEAALPRGVYAYKGDIKSNRYRDKLDIENYKNHEVAKIICIALEEGSKDVHCKVIGNTLFASMKLFPDKVYTDGKDYTLVIPDDQWYKFNLDKAFTGEGKSLEVMGTGFWWGKSGNRAYRFMKTEERFLTLQNWGARKIKVKPVSLAQHGWRKACMHDLHEFQVRLDILDEELAYNWTGNKLKDILNNRNTLNKIDQIKAKMQVIELELANPDRWSKKLHGKKEVPVFDFAGNQDMGYKTVGVQSDVAESETFSMLIDEAAGITLGVVYLDPAFFSDNVWAEVEPVMVNGKLRVKATFVEEPAVIEDMDKGIEILEQKKDAAKVRLEKIKAML